MSNMGPRESQKTFSVKELGDLALLLKEKDIPTFTGEDGEEYYIWDVKNKCWLVSDEDE